MRVVRLRVHCHTLKALQIKQSNRLIYGNLIPNGSRVSRVGPESSAFCTSNLLPVNYWEANTKKTLLFLETFLVKNH